MHVLYKPTRAKTIYFNDFSKISEQIPKISEDFSKVVGRQDKRYETLSEDCRR